MHAKLWSENFNERDQSEDIGVDANITLELILGTLDGTVWTGFVWLRLLSSDGLL